MPTACKQIYKEAINGIKKAKQSKMHYTSVLVGKRLSDPPLTGSATENGSVISSTKLWYDFVHSGPPKNK